MARLEILVLKNIVANRLVIKREIRVTKFWHISIKPKWERCCLFIKYSFNCEDNECFKISRLFASSIDQMVEKLFSKRCWFESWDKLTPESGIHGRGEFISSINLSFKRGIDRIKSWGSKCSFVKLVSDCRKELNTWILGQGSSDEIDCLGVSCSDIVVFLHK